MAKVIAFSNQKGGVGKTTSCVNIAASLGKMGKRVLLVDLDPQGNATSGLGIGKKNVRHSVYEMVLGETPARECIVITKFKNLHVIPSTVELAGAEMDLHAPDSRGANALCVLDEVRENYDYILIDCPPSLGMLTVNALAYANGVIIPMQCEFFALEGLSQLMLTISRIKQHYNKDLNVTGILITMYNSRLLLSVQVINELKKHYADRLFETTISRNVKVSEAPGFGMPVYYHGKRSKGAKEYMNVAKELVERI